MVTLSGVLEWPPKVVSSEPWAEYKISAEGVDHVSRADAFMVGGVGSSFWTIVRVKHKASLVLIQNRRVRTLSEEEARNVVERIAGRKSSIHVKVCDRTVPFEDVGAIVVIPATTKLMCYTFDDSRIALNALMGNSGKHLKLAQKKTTIEFNPVSRENKQTWPLFSGIKSSAP
jgi:hypothetical protein